MRTRIEGFSLVELMIVVAIIGILSAIAVPAYHDYLIKARIADATSALATKRTSLEQYFQDNTTYTGAPACNADTTTSQYFDFSCPTLTATTYVIQADGKNAMTGFTYNVDQSSTKTTTVGAGVPSGWSGSASCWVTGKGGKC